MVYFYFLKILLCYISHHTVHHKWYIFRASYKCDKTIKTENEIIGTKFRVGFISNGKRFKARREHTKGCNDTSNIVFFTLGERYKLLILLFLTYI